MSDHVAVDLALVGFGSVPRAFVDLLRRRAPPLGLRWRIVAVATARHGCALAPDGIKSTVLLRRSRDGARHDAGHDGRTGPVPANSLELLDRLAALRSGRDGDRRLIVVENTPLGLDGGQPGLAHVRAAFAIGADVITANKGPAAFAYRELAGQAAAAGAAFRFEGAVLDGLPVFSLLRETLPGASVTRVRGVVNTTTNHLLAAIEDGRGLDDAVADMQAAGLAEADPALDIDGWDAAAKISVLANTWLDADITPHDVAREGVRAIAPSVVRAARRDGRAVKLVATAERGPQGVAASVAPCLLDADDPLATLSGTAKGIVVDTDMLGPVMISKPASDVTHTAYALLADLASIHRRISNLGPEGTGE